MVRRGPTRKTWAWLHELLKSSLLGSLACAVWLILVAGAIAGCSRAPKEPQELLVFAAASLAGALGDIEDAFEGRGSESVSFSYGGSQMLAQQIASGAPADVIISAGRPPVDFLDRKGLLEPERADILANRLVVVIRSQAVLQVDSLQELRAPVIRRIAIAEPTLAPAGRYARESLEHSGLWDALQPKMVFGADVRATLAYVESGNAEAALVYATDARAARNVRVLDIVPEDSYSGVVYPAAVVKGRPLKTAAVTFLGFLRSPAAQEIFRMYGFEPVQ